MDAAYLVSGRSSVRVFRILYEEKCSRAVSGRCPHLHIPISVDWGVVNVLASGGLLPSTGIVLLLEGNTATGYAAPFVSAPSQQHVVVIDRIDSPVAPGTYLVEDRGGPTDTRVLS